MGVSFESANSKEERSSTKAGKAVARCEIQNDEQEGVCFLQEDSMKRHSLEQMKSDYYFVLVLRPDLSHVKSPYLPRSLYWREKLLTAGECLEPY